MPKGILPRYQQAVATGQMTPEEAKRRSQQSKQAKAGPSPGQPQYSTSTRFIGPRPQFSTSNRFIGPVQSRPEPPAPRPKAKSRRAQGAGTMFQNIARPQMPYGVRKSFPSGTGLGLRAYLKGLSLSLKCPFPTRMEYFTFRATFQLHDTSVLQASNKDNLRILFHPSRSVSHAAAVSGLWSASFGADDARGNDDGVVQPSGDTHPASTNFLNWVDESAVQIESGVSLGTHSIINNNVQVEAIGMPTQLLSNSCRVLGGICNLRIQSGTTVRGHIAHMCLSNEENKLPVKDLVSQMRTNTNIGRKYLEPGVHDYTFHAPLQNRAAISAFGPVGSRFSWDADDPFCGLLLAFNDITFSTVDAPPVVTFSYMVPVQVQLDQSVRHFATKEACTTVEAIEGNHSMPQGHVGKNIFQSMAEPVVSAVSSAVHDVARNRVLEFGEHMIGSAIGGSAPKLFGKLTARDSATALGGFDSAMMATFGMQHPIP